MFLFGIGIAFAIRIYKFFPYSTTKYGNRKETTSSDCDYNQ
jgi:hypothetical protein